MIKVFFKFDNLPVDFDGDEMWSYLDYINLQGLIETELPFDIGVDLIPLNRENNTITMAISLFRIFDNNEIINYAIPIDCIYNNIDTIKNVLVSDNIYLLQISDNLNKIQVDKLISLLTN